jgi:hypothetical protein
MEGKAMDDELAWKLADLRGQIAELGSAIRQLRQAGLDSAPAQLLITRKRAELEVLLVRRTVENVRSQ